MTWNSLAIIHIVIINYINTDTIFFSTWCLLIYLNFTWTCIIKRCELWMNTLFVYSEISDFQNSFIELIKFVKLYKLNRYRGLWGWLLLYLMFPWMFWIEIWNIIATFRLFIYWKHFYAYLRGLVYKQYWIKMIYNRQIGCKYYIIVRYYYFWIPKFIHNS